jgi:hypothetical protein
VEVNGLAVDLYSMLSEGAEMYSGVLRGQFLD